MSATFRTVVPVRFADVDLQGHVHHAAALVLLEEARIAFFAELAHRAGVDLAMSVILARVEVDYRAPIPTGTREVEVEVIPEAPGRTSFALRYRLHAAGSLALEARTVQVHFDYEARTPIPLPPVAARALKR